MYSRYIKPEVYIESNYQPIVQEATRLNDSNPWITGQNVLSFVHGYLTYTLGLNGNGAEFAMDSKKGVCFDYACLSVALLRACGIPARMLQGLDLQNRSDTYLTSYGLLNTNSGTLDTHAWIEYYIPGTGWIVADPTWNLINEIDDVHLLDLRGLWIQDDTQLNISDKSTPVPSIFPHIISNNKDYSYELLISYHEISGPLSTIDLFQWIFYPVYSLLPVLAIIQYWRTLRGLKRNNKAASARQ